jgi:chemotaxis protein CheX
MKSEWILPFIQGTQKIVEQMVGIELIPVTEDYPEPEDLTSLGICSVISFSNKIKGRLIIDLSPDLAEEIAFLLLGERPDSIKDRMLIAAISEMNNTIAGEGCTVLNNAFQFGLRLSPPIITVGKNMIISSQRIDSKTIHFKSPIGQFKINIGFQKGGDLT